MNLEQSPAGMRASIGYAKLIYEAAISEKNRFEVIHGDINLILQKIVAEAHAQGFDECLSKVSSGIMDIRCNAKDLSNVLSENDQMEE